MKFTVATFVALVAAATAMPSYEQAPKISQASLKKIEETENKCGDANVNCCISVPKDTNAQKYDGLAGLISDVLSPDSNAYCAQASNPGVIPLDLLPDLLGGNKGHLCDNTDVTYVCCAGGECHLPEEKKDGKEAFWSRV
ncbi:hypothetical protein ASPVEDRAFT_82421 [Aspergillus versicolor CBS 583.65]|uniref:Hydrophobin n=1 Tax=Aspergillus versicolor CBS 583.65 TaxID=1036611 RepID=A0A1L9PH81_ASPVE|nr:uncharacterized protein ASPVEDRAFT_82421 [Aspergillus versicolor CBS 583.65]OJJ00869.1 hypothetical protein ASPVEDRAFT_82421 [Aspergillus versicolor CBS 583.65]